MSLHRIVLGVPHGICTIRPCMTVRAPWSRFKCRGHVGPPLTLSGHVLCGNMRFVGTPVTDVGERDVLGRFLIFSVGARTRPPPSITNSTSGSLITAMEFQNHHHITVAQEKDDVEQKLADEYTSKAVASPQQALRFARRQAASEKTFRRQGREDAIRMVTQAQAAGDPYFRAPIVSPETGYIFPAICDTNVRRVTSLILSMEADEYYKSVEAVGLQRDGCVGHVFVLAITTKI